MSRVKKYDGEQVEKRNEEVIYSDETKGSKNQVVKTSIWISHEASKKKFVLILEQVISKADPDRHVHRMFKLFSSKQEGEVMKTFKGVKEIIQPLSCVPLSLELLRIILSSEIKKTRDLPSLILKYIHSNHTSISTSEIAALATVQINGRSLMHYACKLNDNQTLEILLQHAALENPTLLLYSAAKVSPQSLRVLIENMRKVFTQEEIINELNKPNNDQSASIKLNRLVREKSKMFDSCLAFMSEVPFGFMNQQTGGVTPLMIACKNQVTLTVANLLIEGVDPNVQDPGSGNTALHIAVILDNNSIVQILLAYNADMTIANNDNLTPFKLAEINQQDKEECFEILNKVSSARNKAMQFTKGTSKQKMDRESLEKTVSLLSFDGGGTCAVVAIFTLYYIENIMRDISGQRQLSILPYFNWLAGTSSGSILISAIVYYHNMSIGQLMEIMVNEKDEIFHGKRIYDAENLEKVVKKYVHEARICSITEPRVLITTVQADISPPKLELITNYRNQENERIWRVWEAIRASTAAPTYFHSFEGKYVDGGILAVNPILYAMSDIHRYDERKLKFVLSLGAGESPVLPIDSIDLVIPKVSLNFIADLKANFHFITGLMNMLTAGVSNMEGPVNQAQDWCEAIGASYHRFSAPLSKDLSLDTKDDSDIVLLIYDAYMHCLERTQELYDIAVILLKQGPM